MDNSGLDISAANYNQKKNFLNSNFHCFIFALLLLMGGYFRHFGLFLPSHIGDASAYQSLAMKMNHGFMSNYDIYHYRMIPRQEKGLVDYVWENNPKHWQSRRIRKDFHLPLHIQPPAFSIMIWVSHGIFNHGEPYTSVTKNPGRSLLKNPPWHYLKAQFYAVIVPFCFSILTLVLVYFFCLKYFSWREGIFALLLLIASPVEMMVGSRVLPDAIGEALGLLGLLLYFKGLEEDTSRPVLWSMLAGTCLGIGFLTKLTGVLFAAGFFWATLVFPRKTRTGWQRLLDPRLWSAALMAFLISLPWNLLVYKTYHHLLPPSPVDLNSPWHSFVFNRPAYAYFAGMLYMIPAMGLGWGYGLYSLLRPCRYYLESTLMVVSVVFLFTLMILLKTQSAGMEHRYLLPAYPLIAILTGRALVVMLGWIKQRWAYSLVYLASLGGLSWLAWRAAKMGLHHTFGAYTAIKAWGL